MQVGDQPATPLAETTGVGGAKGELRKGRCAGIAVRGRKFDLGRAALEMTQSRSLAQGLLDHRLTTTHDPIPISPLNIGPYRVWWTGS